MKTKTLFVLSSALGRMTPIEQAMGRYMRAPDEHPAGDDDDAFASAFDAAANEDAGAAPTPTPTPGADAGDAATPAAPDAAAGGDAAGTPDGGEGTPAGGDDKGAGDTPTPADAGAAPQDPPADAGSQPAAAPTPQDIVAQLTEALKGAQPAQPTQPAQPAQPAAEQPQEPIYNDQELAVLADYEKNWPDVAAAEALKRRAEYHDLLTFTFKTIRDWMQPRLETIDALSNMAHEQQLKTAVPDYTPDLESQVAAWVDTQPAYLQAGMKQVMQSGTSEEVADLIGRYRAATGTQPASAAAPATPAPKVPAAAPKTELSSAAKQAAESLAPVSGDRTAVPQGEDPLDYETAFQKYAAAGAT